MKCGRELDFLIAEKVFEKIVVPDGLWATGERDVYPHEVPHYSTSLKDALKILKKLEPNHYKLDYTDDRQEKYYCSISLRPSAFSALADTMALTICLCALKAVGYKDNAYE